MAQIHLIEFVVKLNEQIYHSLRETDMFDVFDLVGHRLVKVHYFEDSIDNDSEWGGLYFFCYRTGTLMVLTTLKIQF